MPQSRTAWNWFSKLLEKHKVVIFFHDIYPAECWLHSNEETNEWNVQIKTIKSRKIDLKKKLDWKIEFELDNKIIYTLFCSK